MLRTAKFLLALAPFLVLLPCGSAFGQSNLQQVKNNQASPKLLEHLLPFLKSENKALRRRAADALGTYHGTEVVDALIPLLGDQEKIIQLEAINHLLDQKDNSMLKVRLSDAVDNSQSESIREKSKELLSKLTKERK